MEERNIWLPAGLESSGLEPDDRASARSERGRAKGPSASGTWQPYDPDRPESKRSRRDEDEARPEADTADAGKRREPAPAERAREETHGDETDADPPRAKRTDDSDRARREREAERDDGRDDGRSDVDAMGQDKHRKVIGQRYGASRTKQVAYYGIFVAFVIAAYIGLKTAADHLDKAPAHDPDKAPWSKPGAPDEPLGGFTPKTPGAKGPTNFQ